MLSSCSAVLERPRTLEAGTHPAVRWHGMKAPEVADEFFRYQAGTGASSQFGQGDTLAGTRLQSPGPECQSHHCAVSQLARLQRRLKADLRAVTPVIATLDQRQHGPMPLCRRTRCEWDMIQLHPLVLIRLKCS